MLIYCDSVILIYFLDHTGPFNVRAAARMTALRAAGDQVAVSDLTRLECRVKPMRLLKLHQRHLGAQRRSVMREERSVPDLPDESVLELANRLAASGTSPSRQAARQEQRRRVQAALAERDRGRSCQRLATTRPRPGHLAQWLARWSARRNDR